MTLITPNNDDSSSFFILNKRIIIFFIYCLFGLAMMAFLIITISTHITHLKVETAVVNLPIEPISSPVSGVIKTIFVNPDDTIKQGASLFQIENIDMERDLLLAQIEKNETKLHLLYLRNLLNNEEKRLAFYKNIGTRRVESAQALLSLSKQSITTIKNNFHRYKILHDKHYISDADWDIVVAKYHTAQFNLKKAIADHEVENNSLSELKEGLYFTGGKIEGAFQDLKAQIESAEKKLQIKSDKVNVYLTILNKLLITSPFDGKVIQVLKSSGSSTDNIKPIILLQQAKPKMQILAYLTQNEITRVELGKNVTIYIPPLNKTFSGKIVNINRTTAFADSTKSQYQWRDLQVDRTAVVTIDISKKSLKEYSRKLMAGMPATVYFSTKISRYIF